MDSPAQGGEEVRMDDGALRALSVLLGALLGLLIGLVAMFWLEASGLSSVLLVGSASFLMMLLLDTIAGDFIDRRRP
jgi:uncharacterized membrane protein YhiD involved in acid resistance